MSALDVHIERKLYPARAEAASHLAIADLKFTVEPGEFVCILGPSGCGKTTLLNMIAELDRDYEGRIRREPADPDKLAYVFQTPRLLPWRTTEQNIALVMDDGANTRATVAELIEAVGLDGFAASFPGQLSLGMQRRAALARGFARAPEILLLDEPFVSLDQEAALRLRTLLIEILAARPATVIFVTHDRREAAALADRILILSGAPARVAGEVRVALDRQERADPDQIESFCQQYLHNIAVELDGSAAS